MGWGPPSTGPPTAWPPFYGPCGWRRARKQPLPQHPLHPAAHGRQCFTTAPRPLWVPKRASMGAFYLLILARACTPGGPRQSTACQPPLGPCGGRPCCLARRNLCFKRPLAAVCALVRALCPRAGLLGGPPSPRQALALLHQFAPWAEISTWQLSVRVGHKNEDEGYFYLIILLTTK